MVAASKLRRVQEAVQHAKPYVQFLEEMLGSLAYSARHVKHPLLTTRPVKKTGYLVITADRGLAGAYNANIIRMAIHELRSKDRDGYAIFAVGRKGRDAFKRGGYTVTSEITGLSDAPTYEGIQSLAEDVVNAYAQADFDELYLIYNEFINAMTQRPVMRKVLPLSDLDTHVQSQASYLYEPDEDAVLSKLLPRYVEMLIYQAALDAKASEHGARMASMQNATDNAGEMIDALTLQLNRARQTAITTQISEVVGGAEALK